VIGQIAGVAVSLPGELTVVARVMVNPEATFSQVPAIVRGLTVGLPEIVV
jgi:hypothetical protein